MTPDTLALSYVACALLVSIYAWSRFNTPSTNRSSTRRMLYWSSCSGYVATALVLYTALSILLGVGPWRAILVGGGVDASLPALPAPLIAALVMTTLLSSVPILKNLDSWFLSVFLDWGAIPAELKRRAATMTTRTFSVTADDVARLRTAYGDGSCGETLADHLREDGSEGIELSERRLTRVAKIYFCIQSLEAEHRYASFFAGADEQLKEIKSRMAAFLRNSDKSLTLAVRLRALEGQAAYEELMQERRETFAQNCRDMFHELAQFLAAAVLRSELTEKDIVRRLRSLGFESAEPMTEPVFPIHSLTLLAFGLFAYLAVLTIFFSHMKDVPQPHSPMLGTSKVFLTRIITVGVVVWLMQTFTFFRRNAGEARKYFSYAVCGIIAAAAGVCVCVPFALLDLDGLAAGLYNSLPLIFLSGILCVALAFCCDDWPEDSDPPIWLRSLEAAGCAAIMAFGASLLYFGDMLPASMGTFAGIRAVAWICLPSAMAAVIGGFVPHIYRSAHRAAAARRREALRVDPGAPGANVSAASPGSLRAVFGRPLKSLLPPAA
jgi:hypothetical protein